jgi:hypothetical protein
MNLQFQLEGSHKEHEEILAFLTRWEETLNRIASEEYEIRLQALRQLQGMEEKIAAICDHCREEEAADSPLILYTSEADKARMRYEHFRLYQANHDLRHEMAFATAEHTDELCKQGRDFLEALRSHVAYEEGLLNRIEAEQLKAAELQTTAVGR